jgi:hypothetical protein
MGFQTQIPFFVIFHQFLQLIVHLADADSARNADAVLLIRIIVALGAFLHFHLFGSPPFDILHFSI